jgi:hypothetical protein
MLSDFGCAVNSGTTCPFAGTLRFAPTAVLQSYVTYPRVMITCQPSHDLESAMKLLWICLNDRNGSLYEIGSGDAPALLEFWKDTDPLLSPGWLEAARQCNYDSLLTLLKPEESRARWRQAQNVK